MIRFIDEYRDRFSIEFICTTLKNNREGGFITSRGYRHSKARGLSSRTLRDTALVEHIRKVHSDNYGVYGIRKIWHALRREGIGIGREQTARLMRLAGLSGKFRVYRFYRRCVLTPHCRLSVVPFEAY